MEGFQVTEIGEKIYCILDAGNSSFYVVEGEEKAAVIDTGITAGAKILPVIRELTDKPLLLVITHAHPDHMYHIDEFDEVYMCHEEKKMDPETLVMLTAGKLKPWEEILISVRIRSFRLAAQNLPSVRLRAIRRAASLCWRRNRITCSPEMRSEAAAVSGCRCRAERAWKSITTGWSD